MSATPVRKTREPIINKPVLVAVPELKKTKSHLTPLPLSVLRPDLKVETKAEAKTTFNFWTLIDVIHWCSIDEGTNKPKPKMINGWTPETLPLIRSEVKRHADILLSSPSFCEFVDSDTIYRTQPALQKLLAWHIVGKGRLIYEAVKANGGIAAAYIHQENDFEAFLS